MGERKGQNKYYPPDYDPKVGGLNKFLGTHALRERAKKIHLGIIIIRFEMPYNIWCDGCKNHIGMGVRYNAEKTKVGMYYSTPVYQFRMKCHLCDNYIEIKTDPGNLDYEIVSGARRQENRWDPNENGQIVADTKETQRKLFDDPMYKLEHVATDAKKSDDAKPRLYNLYERNHYVWDDDYSANCKLRAAFRNRKKELKSEEARDNALLAKSSLDIELLPESDQDARLAAMMQLQSAKTVGEREREQRHDVINRPALPSATITTFGGLRTEKLLSVKLSRKDLGIVNDSTSGKKRKSIATDTEIIALDKKRKEMPTATATKTTLANSKASKAIDEIYRNGNVENQHTCENTKSETDEPKMEHSSGNSHNFQEIRNSSDSSIHKIDSPTMISSLSLVLNYSSSSSCDEQ